MNRERLLIFVVMNFLAAGFFGVLIGVMIGVGVEKETAGLVAIVCFLVSVALGALAPIAGRQPE